MGILVTGGAGYIGSHTVRLLEKKKNIVVYDNLSKGHKGAVKGNVFVEGNIFDKDLLRDTIRRHNIRSVVHFAAFSLVGESMSEPGLYYQNNVGGTLSLLDSMMECGVKELVFSSTAAVYGEPEESPIRETAGKCPTNVYGRTKLMMEQVMADYARAYGLRYTALRYFNACGADPAGDIGEDHNPETHLIPRILQACSGKSPEIKIYGDDYNTPDGTCIRDYIHVNDLAAAHDLALQSLQEGRPGTAYNLGNGNGFSVKEIVAAAEAVTGITARKEVVARREGDPAALVASSEKIRQELGWKPAYQDIREIIATAWRWHEKNPDGFSGGV